MKKNSNYSSLVREWIINFYLAAKLINQLIEILGAAINYPNYKNASSK
jgi:hypothetical protein